MIRSFNMARSNLTARTLTFAALIAAPLFVTAVARADVTCGDTTCAKGLTCVSTPTPCPAIIDINNGKGSNCVPTTSYACVPADCTTTDDCGDGMVCYKSTSSICSGGASKPACDPAAPDCGAQLEDVAVSCESTSRQQCTPRYELPCRVASDCGGGFTCEEVIETSCIGSGGATGVGTATGGTATPSEPTATSGSGVAASGGAASIMAPSGGAATRGGATSKGGSSGSVVANGATGNVAEPADQATLDIAMPIPPECTSVATGRYQCVLQTIVCAADTDCPVGLACQASSSGTCWASSDGTQGCTTPTTVKSCQPKYYGSRDSGSITTATGSNGETTGTAPTTPPVDKSNSATPTADGTTATPSDPGNVSGGGCAVAKAAPSSFGSLLMLMLSFGLGSRLRRRTSTRAA